MVSSCSQVIFQALGFDFFFPSMSMVPGRFCGCQELVICFYFGGWDTLLPSINLSMSFLVLISCYLFLLYFWGVIQRYKKLFCYLHKSFGLKYLDITESWNDLIFFQVHVVQNSLYTIYNFQRLLGADFSRLVYPGLLAETDASHSIKWGGALRASPQGQLYLSGLLFGIECVTMLKYVKRKQFFSDYSRNYEACTQF